MLTCVNKTWTVLFKHTVSWGEMARNLLKKVPFSIFKIIQMFEKKEFHASFSSGSVGVRILSIAWNELQLEPQAFQRRIRLERLFRQIVENFGHDRNPLLRRYGIVVVPRRSPFAEVDVTVWRIRFLHSLSKRNKKLSWKLEICCLFQRKKACETFREIYVFNAFHFTFIQQFSHFWKIILRFITIGWRKSRDLKVTVQVPPVGPGSHLRMKLDKGQ